MARKIVGTNWLFYGFLITVFFFCSSCDHNYNESVVFDSILELPVANREFEQVVIDLSDRSDYHYLVDGWHLPEPGKVPFSRIMWSQGQISQVLFPITEVHDCELLICMRPLIFEGSSPCQLTVQMNDKYIGSIDLANDWQVYRLVIPSESIHSGENILILHHSTAFRPMDVWKNSNDSRLLSASYSYFVLRPIREPLSPGMYTLSQILGAENFQYKGLQRYVLVDHNPCQFCYDIKLPSRPYLNFAVGMLPETIEKGGPPSSFEVSVTDKISRKKETVFSRKVFPPRRTLETGWTEYRRDLNKYAGHEIELCFKTVRENSSINCNQGSWLEPQIFNKHAALNWIVLVGKGPDWPPRKPQQGSAMAHLYDLSLHCDSVKLDSEFGNLTDDTIGFPLRIVRKMRFEGWQVGYFYTGKDEKIIEDFFAPEFDSLVGQAETTAETCQNITQESYDWIRRLSTMNFMMTVEFANSEFDDAIQHLEMERFVEIFFNYQMDLDTILLLLNTDGEKPNVLFIPNQGSQTPFQSDTEWKQIENKIWMQLDLSEV